MVWPENVIDVNGVAFADSPERAASSQRRPAASRRRSSVGVTEDEGEHFRNAQIVVTPDGQLVSRYDKVRRVPFGEYVPLRGLIEGARGAGLPAPATRCRGPRPRCSTCRPAPLAVIISWEVFFADRARDGVPHGGTLLLNPTNGSTYSRTILQTQQVASSRLRAIETGRWVAQVGADRASRPS